MGIGGMCGSEESSESPEEGSWAKGSPGASSGLEPSEDELSGESPGGSSQSAAALKTEAIQWIIEK